MTRHLQETCTSYYTSNNTLVNSFGCPRKDDTRDLIYCCGFADLKYCCNEPGNYFPYKHDYMLSLSIGALIGLAIAALVLLAFVVSVCVLCYLFLYTKPQRIETGLKLQHAGSSSSHRGNLKKKAKSGQSATSATHLNSTNDIPCDTEGSVQEKLAEVTHMITKL
ncbi:protein shisa-like-2B [Engystomops pustulosus]|uniref:protein shisa-like-2B n=1 Tax=Engystomops pustulosus TaxID=76066 RepID=UPI003AFA9906